MELRKKIKRKKEEEVKKEDEGKEEERRERGEGVRVKREKTGEECTPVLHQLGGHSEEAIFLEVECVFYLNMLNTIL